MAIRARKTKRGTVYDVTVYVGKDAHGNRIRHYETCATKADARVIEARLIAESRALAKHSGQLTLSAYIERVYWPVAVHRLAPSSLETYERDIRLRILPTLGDMPLRDIDRAAIQKMVDNCATRTVAKKALNTLKTILFEAMSDDYITRNPATGNFALPSNAGKPRDNGLVLSTFDAIHAALDVIDNAPIFAQRLVYTGLLQGLRPEERYALTWSCFDLRAETITISAARTAAAAQFGGVHTKAPKTPQSRRVIPMHPRFVAWLRGQPRENELFLFGAHGQPISPSTAQKRWTRYLASNADFPPLTIENMRHSFATAYLAAGGQLEVLSRILGHTNISTTVNRYYRPDVDVLAADMRRITDDSRNICAGNAAKCDNAGVRFSAPPPTTNAVLPDDSGFVFSCESGLWLPSSGETPPYNA